jgi:acetyltransferase
MAPDLAFPRGAPLRRPEPDGALLGEIRLKSGWRLPLRTIGPADAEAVQVFVRGLSSESRYARFFGPLRELSPEQLERMTRAHYPDHLGLVALDARAGEASIAGIAQYASCADDDAPEFAIVVGDRWQRQGLGTQLLLRLIETARAAGFRALQGLVLAGNHPMLALAVRLGFSLRPSGGALFFRAEKALSEAAPQN